MARMITMVLCVVLTCMVLVAPYADAIDSCRKVRNGLKPCVSYLQNGGEVPRRCCKGIIRFNEDVRTTADRRLVCTCSQIVGSEITGIKPDLAEGLPALCGVDLGYNFTLTTDCATVP